MNASTASLHCDIVGFKVDGEDDYIKRWTLSRSWDDMVLHETLFVPCSTVEDLKKELARRSGTTAAETAWLVHSRTNGNELYEYKVPLLKSIGPGWYQAVMDVLGKSGDVLIKADLARHLRADPVFQASNLVISGNGIVLSVMDRYYAPPYYYLIRINPKAAKGRRTRAASYEERRKKLEAEKKLQEAKDAIARQKNAAQEAIDSKNLAAFDKAASAATERMYKATPFFLVSKVIPNWNPAWANFQQFVDLLLMCEVVVPDAFNRARGHGQFRPFENPKIVRALKLAVKHKRLWEHYWRSEVLAGILRRHGYPDFRLPRKKKSPR